MPTIKELMMKEVQTLFKDFFEEQGKDMVNDPDPISQQIGLAFLKQANKMEKKQLEKEPPRSVRVMGDQLLFPLDVKDDLFVEHIAIHVMTNRKDTVYEVYEMLEKQGWKKVTDKEFTPDFGKMTKDGSLLKIKSDTIMVYGDREMIKAVADLFVKANSENFVVEGYEKPIAIKKTTEKKLSQDYENRKTEIEKFMLDSLKKHSNVDAYLIDDTKREFYPEPHSVDVERGFRGKPYHFNEFAMNLIESMKKRNLIEERKNRLVFKPKTIVMGNEGKARELTNTKGM